MTRPSARQPDVSVIIPTRDRWTRLRRTLESALSQVDVTVEVIVVDDGSSDETPTRMSRIGRPSVHYLRHERSLGPAAARNTGIAAARGEWLAFLDDDDLWAPWKLRRQVDVAGAEAASFAYASAVVVDDEFRPLELYEAPATEDLRSLLVRGNAVPAGASNVLAGTESVRAIGGFDDHLSQLADWDLWIRLARSGRGAPCHEVLVAYVYHPGNLVLTPARELWTEFDHVARKHADVARAWGTGFDQAGLTYWIASRQAEAGLRLRAVQTYLRGALAARRPVHLRLAARTLVRGVRPANEPAARIPTPDWLNAHPRDGA
jgi:glycosyltransferase involved in cell wall biosynthesis